ncbi:aldehyde dehydrogenase family protein (plasmid) [Erwinia sp. INIA-01]|uniref:aldehyde dehydrogenase family protein n=1 Tax=Erwinia sp. INIA01 TaxID=2991500 RepID=UPI0022254B6F|nr:aldehyde dehydrogenase family protein [Erwinia sp. INIA01]MCW1873077.1 aldehyde dehydrogenase family protein [Erwinia sp. INIA01]
MTFTNQLFINGQWVAPVRGGSFDTIDPANETAIAQVAAATAEDVDRAVQAARNAFDHGGWPELSGKVRAGYLRRIASLIRDRQQTLAELEVRDNGKPLPEALWDIGDTAYCFDFYADLAEQLDAQQEKAVALSDERFSSVARKEPVGVCGAIIPWNFPMLMAAWKVAPALAAGCTVVLKPSEVTPLTALQLADIAREAELPPGVLNVITGLGADAGSPLTEHPDVDKLAFTGSVPTGRKIMQAAAAEIKNVSLELGGKSAFIIFDDSDIEKAVEWILFGIFWNKGEVCSATSRVLVQRNLYDALLARLVEEAERIRIGNGMADGVLLGPLVNAAQYEKVQTAIARGIEQGATLLSGGKRPNGHDKGYFLQPTIFTDVSEESDIWREEIFGPVVCVRAFDDEAEAVASANRSRFGLAAAVMSPDLARAERVARRLRAGIVWINCSQPTFTEAPWGGYKQSGIGRELGEWGLNNYLETKQITRYDSDEPWGWYIK